MNDSDHLPSSQNDIRALISAAKLGREEAWEEILTVYGQRLYGYFFRATRSHHDAEDLLSELMVRLVRKIDDYDEHGRFEPWLFRIATNLLRDCIRRRRVAPAMIRLEGDDEDAITPIEMIETKAQPVETGLIANDNAKQVSELLDCLDEQSRQMILLRFFGQMRFKEIAEIFNCPVGTVLARVHRALKLMQKSAQANGTKDEQDEPDR